MRRPILIALAGVAALASPAAAQTWGRYDSGYSYESRSYDGDYRYGRSDGRDGYRRDSNAVPSTFDWRAQLDRPGDYRCDQFWDANRDDCGGRWRDQRDRVSPQARRDYRELAGYRYADDYGGDRRHYGSGFRRRGYGGSYGYGGHGQGGTTYEGAYGRPDVVFPGGGRRYASYGGGRDARRIDWCQATYRSYDPHSGHYRAYSGRLIWCG